jgi:hypothetical protein
MDTVEESFSNLKCYFLLLGTKVMITAGRPISSAKKTEVVDVESGETCADLADFPLTNHNAVGANLDGTPIVCGGYSSGFLPTRVGSCRSSAI